MLGIRLVDSDIFDVPLLADRPVRPLQARPATASRRWCSPNGGCVEGNPAATAARRAVPANALHTGHAFLNDIAHNAVPSAGLTPDADTTICDFRSRTRRSRPGTYDDELLDAHFITGDGRGNENIALTDGPPDLPRRAQPAGRPTSTGCINAGC